MNEEKDSLSPAQRLISDMKNQSMDIQVVASRLLYAITQITGYSFNECETSSPKKDGIDCMHQDLENTLISNSSSYHRLVRCVCELEQYVGINSAIQND